MNIPGIGPNLNIAPMADPGDGGFDVVLVPESQREDFISYIEDKLNDVRDSTFFSAIRAKKVKIYCEETLLHIDDKIMELTEPRTLTAEVMSDPLLFFKGNNGSPALN